MSEPWHECPICKKKWPPGPGVVKPCHHTDEEWREYRREAFIDGMIAMAMTKQDCPAKEFSALCAKYLW